MSLFADQHVYQALVLPDDALNRGGVEILRAGVIDNELYVSARHAFKDPAQWGEVLADITRRLAQLYAAEGEYAKKEVVAAIASAFAADLGAPAVGKRASSRRKGAPRVKAVGRTAPDGRKSAGRASTKRAKMTKGAKTAVRRTPRDKR